jgi:hypothetical protein
VVGAAVGATAGFSGGSLGAWALSEIVSIVQELNTQTQYQTYIDWGRVAWAAALSSFGDAAEAVARSESLAETVIGIGVPAALDLPNRLVDLADVYHGRTVIEYPCPCQ